MKLVINKKQLTETPELWLRRTGYAYILDRASGQASFVRRLTRDFYPRFHLYWESEINQRTQEEKIIFNIHLDQKKPGYVGYNRHNAEYDGEAVEQEVERLRQLLLPDFFN